MGALKGLLQIVGVLSLLLGLLFVAQGSGYLPWPRSSFMIGAHQWVYYGGAIAVVGLLLMLASH